MESQEQDAKARPRGPNFSEQEKDLLVDLVAPYQRVIECNITNKKSNEHKNSAWEEIGQKFNSQNASMRSTASLRNLYSTMKSGAKKKVAEQKVNLKKNNFPFLNVFLFQRETRATGGGPAPRLVGSATEKLVSLLGSKIEPLENPYDSNREWITTKRSRERNDLDVYFDDNDNNMEEYGRASDDQISNLDEPAASVLISSQTEGLLARFHKKPKLSEASNSSDEEKEPAVIVVSRQNKENFSSSGNYELTQPAAHANQQKFCQTAAFKKHLSQPALQSSMKRKVSKASVKLATVSKAAVAQELFDLRKSLYTQQLNNAKLEGEAVKLDIEIKRQKLENEKLTNMKLIKALEE